MNITMIKIDNLGNPYKIALQYVQKIELVGQSELGHNTVEVTCFGNDPVRHYDVLDMQVQLGEEPRRSSWESSFNVR